MSLHLSFDALLMFALRCLVVASSMAVGLGVGYVIMDAIRGYTRFRWLSVCVCVASLTAIMFLALSGCGSPARAQLPKEKYFRGNIVSTKLDHRRGTVVGKSYVGSNASGMAHDVWLYTVRFPNPGAGEAYNQCNLYEFELEPAPAEEKR